MKKQEAGPRKYMLITDDDGHWYIIPSLKGNDWYTFLEDPEMPYKALPSWAKPVGGSYALVTFDEYHIF
jgi:hypothetical protein